MGVIVVGAGRMVDLVTAAYEVKVKPGVNCEEVWEAPAAVVTEELVWVHSLTERVEEGVTACREGDTEERRGEPP